MLKTSIYLKLLFLQAIFGIIFINVLYCIYEVISICALVNCASWNNKYTVQCVWNTHKYFICLNYWI